MDGSLCSAATTPPVSSENRRYLKSHEYIALDGEIGTVGISDFAQAELGEIVYVELPEVNDDPFAEGWMMKVKLDDTSATDSLLDESAYKEHCAKAEH
eukprot:SM000023S07675  [mRNA]  locus=s23:785945:786594:- [translate_table: standard]